MKFLDPEAAWLINNYQMTFDNISPNLWFLFYLSDNQ